MLCALTRFPQFEAKMTRIPARPRTLTRGLCLAVVLLSGCGGSVSDPEAEIRAWIDTAEMAAENRNRRALMAGVADHYADARGNGRDDINDIVRIYMLRQQSIAVISKIDEIVLSDDSAAQVALTVGMAGTNDNALGLSADAYRFELELEKDGDDWLLIGARWGEVGGELR